MSAPDDFERLRDAALAARAEGQSELLAKLMGASAEVLAYRDPHFWEQLGPEGRRRLFSALSAQSAAVSTPGVRPPLPWTRRGRSQLTLAELWTRTPPVLRGIGVGVFAWLVCIAIGALSLIRIGDNPDPVCRRLNEDHARCIYAVQSGLSWDAAAARAGVDVETLHRSNPAVTSPDLWPGTTILIDRSSPSVDILTH